MTKQDYKINKEEIEKFQEEILTWYAKNKRVFPWREMPDGISLQDRAYRILISEVMSQQTQILRVVSKYEAWIKELPTIESLANAKTSDVLMLWSGLGYNRRALYLQQAAKKICTDFGGIIPQNEKDLRGLPGIGEYTAQAVLCYAFNQQVAVVDTNVRKVILLKFGKCHCEESQRRSKLSHNRDCHASLAMTTKEIRAVAEELLPKRVLRLRSGLRLRGSDSRRHLLKASASEWNQALMDYCGMMLKKDKVPTPKQSKFIGSKRYYRGKIIKILLEKKTVNIAELELLGKDLHFPKETSIKEIIEGLEKEGFVKEKGEAIVLV